MVDTTTSASRQAASNLEKRCSLPLLVSTNLKVLASLRQKSEESEQTHKLKTNSMFCPKEMRQYLDRVLGVVLAALALQLQHNLLGGLGLSIETNFSCYEYFMETE